MYAHQVIETLKISKFHQKPLFNTNVVIKELRQAICFNLKEPAILMNSLGLLDKGKNIHNYDADLFIPPFDRVWIDTNDISGGNITKIGCLVLNLSGNNKYLIYCFEFIKNEFWHINPTGIEVTINPKQNEIICTQVLFFQKEALALKEWEYYEELSHICLGLARCLFMFLSCKNITTQDNEPPLKLNKKRKKTGKQELFTYKTLIIKPTGKKQESQQAQGLWDNRVHLCRGHFKEYTAEKPLFGRVTGRFWWQPSVRGNVKEGVVMKDYKIDATKSNKQM